MKHAHLTLILLMSFVILDIHISAASNIGGDTVVIDGKYTTVSKRHCGIRFDPFSGLYTVTDYSSNGTYINGGTKLQPHTPLQLQPNTVVSIGKGSNSFRLN